MLKPALVALALFFAEVLPAAPAQARCSARTSADKARAIAHHAWQKHGPEFASGRRIANRAYPSPGLTSERDLASYVSQILEGGNGERIRSGREKFWDASRGTIVIFNSRARDCGTVFRPNQGRSYYDRQQ